MYETERGAKDQIHSLSRKKEMKGFTWRQYLGLMHYLNSVFNKYLLINYYLVGPRPGSE